MATTGPRRADVRRAAHEGQAGTRRGRAVPVSHVAAGLVALALVTACAPRAAGAVSDEALFAQIRALPGVESSDIHYMYGLGAGDVYGGGIDVERDTDAVCLLDQVYEILWQGRRVDIAVNAFQPGMQTVERRNFLGSQRLVERYGPRPTSPAPAPTVPPCRPPAPDAPPPTPLPQASPPPTPTAR